MAVGVDLGFIGDRPIGRGDAGGPQRHLRYTVPAIVGTLVASAMMNALAFGAQATGWMLYPAVGFGVAIPALIYALSSVAFGLSVAR